MARMVMVFLCVVVSCMVLTAPYAEAAMSCDQVDSKLKPCMSYLTKGGPVPSACCDGVKGLNGAAKATPDRQAACNCLKSAAKVISGINPRNVASLPGKCGVSLPFKISPNINCNTVK